MLKLRYDALLGRKMNSSLKGSVMNKDYFLESIGIPNWQLRNIQVHQSTTSGELSPQIIQSSINPQFICIIETPNIQAEELELLNAIVKACKIELEQLLILANGSNLVELEKVIPKTRMPHFIVLFGENLGNNINLSSYTKNCIIAQTTSLQQLQVNPVAKKQLWQVLQCGIKK